MYKMDQKIKMVREVCKKLDLLEQEIYQIDNSNDILKNEYENAILHLTQQLRDLIA